MVGIESYVELVQQSMDRGRKGYNGQRTEGEGGSTVIILKETRQPEG